MPIRFHTADIRFSLKQKRKLQQFLHQQIVQSSDYRVVNLDFIFCTDAYLLDINRRFLNHDYYTDIITFDLSERPSTDERNEHSLVSEIYISLERVRENSLKFRVPSWNERRSSTTKNPETLNPPDRQAGFETELYRVMFHGVLHLLGYKDKTKKQQEEMRKMEERWLKEYGS